MRLTILGSSGSVPAPGNPASGYLVSSPGAPSLLMDMGPGVLAHLQEIQDPTDTHVAFTHLHTDHCADFASLLVWRRFHPIASAPGRNLCFGPTDTPNRLGRLSSDDPAGIDDMEDTFAFSPWVSEQPELIDKFTVTPYSVVHPIQAYALRVEEHGSGATLAYSGTVPTPMHSLRRPAEWMSFSVRPPGVRPVRARSRACTSVVRMPA